SQDRRELRIHSESQRLERGAIEIKERPCDSIPHRSARYHSNNAIRLTDSWTAIRILSDTPMGCVCDILLRSLHFVSKKNILLDLGFHRCRDTLQPFCAYSL